MTVRCADCGKMHESFDDGCDCGNSFVIATPNHSVPPASSLNTFADNSRETPQLILGDGDTLDELYENGRWIAMDSDTVLDAQCLGN